MRLQTNFDVVNHSWGYTAPFLLEPGRSRPPGSRVHQALSDTAANGRGGLGTIMVVSGGNGRQGDVNDQGNGLRGPNSTNDQSFENSRFVITVAAADRDGRVSDYSDPGASLLITGFGGPGEGGVGNLNVFATDITGTNGYNSGNQQIANQTIDAAYSGFNGTSAAAPTVTGVIALMLEANPRLGWRDVKEILALSASHTGVPSVRPPRDQNSTAGSSTRPTTGMAAACTSRKITASASSMRAVPSGSPRPGAGPSARTMR